MLVVTAISIGFVVLVGVFDVRSIHVISDKFRAN